MTGSPQDPGVLSSGPLSKPPRIFYGWWMVASSFLMMMVSGGILSYGFTAFFNPIIDEFGWTRAETSLAFSLRGLEGGIAQPIIGVLVDRLGPRKLILSGVMAAGVGFVLMAATPSLWYFYATFLLVATGTSAGWGTPQYTAIANWFTTKRSLAMGFLSSSYGVSGIMVPMLVASIAVLGWRWTLVLAGLILIVVGVPNAFVIKHRPPREDPAAGADRVKTPAGIERGRPVPVGLSAVEVLRTRTFWLLIGFVSFSGFAEAAIAVHFIPHLTSLGFSREMGGLILTGATFSSLIGRVGFAWLGDHFSKRHLMAISTVLRLVGVVTFTFMTEPWLIIPFLFTYGPGYGAPIPLMSALQVDYFGLKAFGTVRGLIYTGWTIAAMVGPLVAGWVFDVAGSYQPALVVFSASIVISIPMILAATAPGRAGAPQVC
ncbi:MAG: MFS transporter [Chloroflexi bacterium]|nr:MFS transporter [Chloroflexota bacterium]